MHGSTPIVSPSTLPIPTTRTPSSPTPTQRTAVQPHPTSTSPSTTPSILKRLPQGLHSQITSLQPTLSLGLQNFIVLFLLIFFQELYICIHHVPFSLLHRANSFSFSSFFLCFRYRGERMLPGVHSFESVRFFPPYFRQLSRPFSRAE
jgi:hypothetical protein